MPRLVGIRFGLFIAAVLALPAALMVQADPQLVELGKLVMILSPAVAGLLLNWASAASRAGGAGPGSRGRRA